MVGPLLRSLRLAVALALTLYGALVIGDEPVVRVAILGFRPVAEERARWQPLIDHLNAKVRGYRFRCEVLGYNDLETAISRRTVEFVLTNPGHYVLMTHRNGMSSPLATLMPIEQGKTVSSFGGVMFTKAGRADISRLTDLRDKTIAATSRGSLGGYQAQAMMLLKLGVRIPQDARLIETDMPHDKVVAAVLAGHADGGFVRTGVLEAMAREGKLDPARIKVLEPRQVVDFPFQVCTTLYPEWPFAAMPGVDQDLARRVAAALLALPHGSELAQRMEIRGFNIPADYEPVRAMLEALRLPPFDAIPEFTPVDIWHKYRGPVMIGAALTLVIVALSAWLVTLNRRLAYDQRQLDCKAQEWQGLLTALGDGVYGVGPDRKCTFINPAALAMLGFTSEEVLGHNPHDLFHQRREDGSAYPISDCPVFHTLADGETRHVEDWFMRKDGSMFPVTVTATQVRERDSRQGMVVVFRDISDRLRLETALREEAATDALTRLPNRRYFLAEMDRHLARIVRGEERPSAVMMLDLDEFKQINDTHGHEAGDEVLKHLAALLRDLLRRGDLVGRLGGEEFAVIQVDATQEEAVQLADRMRQRVEATAAPHGTLLLRYTMSVGVTLMIPTDRSVRAPLQRADAALYRAKRNGRNRVEWEPPTATG